MPKADWGKAYEDDVRDTVNELRKARAEARSSRSGRACRVYVPSEQREILVEELTDSDIREVALREAEKATQRAINTFKSEHLING